MPLVPSDAEGLSEENSQRRSQSGTGSDKEKRQQSGQDVGGDGAPSQPPADFPPLPSPALPPGQLPTPRARLEESPGGPSLQQQPSKSTAPEELATPIPPFFQQASPAAGFGGQPALGPSLMQQPPPSQHFPQMPSSNTAPAEMLWQNSAYPGLAAPSNTYPPAYDQGTNHPLPAPGPAYPQQYPATDNSRLFAFSRIEPHQHFFNGAHPSGFFPAADQRRASVNPTVMHQPSPGETDPPHPSPNAIHPRRNTMTAGYVPPRQGNWTGSLPPSTQTGELPGYQPALSIAPQPQQAPFNTAQFQPTLFHTAQPQPSLYTAVHSQPNPSSAPRPIAPRPRRNPSATPCSRRNPPIAPRSRRNPFGGTRHQPPLLNTAHLQPRPLDAAEQRQPWSHPPTVEETEEQDEMEEEV